MITLQRTEDLEVIKSVFEHPDILPEVSDGTLHFPMQDNIYWLLAYSGKLLAGCIVFLPIYSMAWNPHIAILPLHRGVGTEVMRQGCEWMFANTACKKVLAFPFKPIMQRVYQKVGFRVEGYSPKLLYRNGNLLDCQIVGLNK